MSRRPARGTLPRTRRNRRRLDEVLYGLAEGLRVVTLLLYAYMPESVDRLLAALGEDDRARWRRSARAAAARRSGSLRRCSRRSTRPASPGSAGRPGDPHRSILTRISGFASPQRGIWSALPAGWGCGGCSRWGSTRRPTAGRSPPPRRIRRCSHPWAATRTARRASTNGRRPRSRSWRATSGWLRWVRPASTTTAIVPARAATGRVPGADRHRPANGLAGGHPCEIVQTATRPYPTPSPLWPARPRG